MRAAPHFFRKSVFLPRDAEVVEKRVRVADSDVIFAVDKASLELHAFDRSATDPTDDVGARRGPLRTVRPEVSEDEAANRQEHVVLVEFVDARLNRRLGGLFFLLCHFF